MDKDDNCEHKVFFTTELKRIGDVLIKIQEQVVAVVIDVEKLKTSTKIFYSIGLILIGILAREFFIDLVRGLF